MSIEISEDLFNSLRGKRVNTQWRGRAPCAEIAYTYSTHYGCFVTKVEYSQDAPEYFIIGKEVFWDEPL